MEGAARHEVARRNGNIAGLPDDDDAPNLASRRRSLPRFTFARHLEDDVTARPPVALKFPPGSGLGVVENLMRGFALHKLEAFFVPPGTETFMPTARAICTAAVPTPRWRRDEDSLSCSRPRRLNNA